MDYRYRASVMHVRFDQLSDAVDAFCRKAELSPKQILSVLLILEELVTNILKYGSKSDENEEIEVYICIGEEEIDLTVSDNTPFFNPLLATEPEIQRSAEDRLPGGLGLFLVRKFSSSADYQYIDGRNVVHVQIRASNN